MNINQLTDCYRKLEIMAKSNEFMRSDIYKLQNKIITQIGLIYVNNGDNENE